MRSIKHLQRLKTMRIFENENGDKIEIDDIGLFSTPIIITKFNNHEKFNIDYKFFAS